MRYRQLWLLYIWVHIFIFALVQRIVVISMFIEVPTPCVSNGAKLRVWVQGQVRTAPDPLKRVLPHEKPTPACYPAGFTCPRSNQQQMFSLQLSIWVLIVLRYDVYVKDAVSGALSPPGLRFVIWLIFGESLWITRDFLRNFIAIQWIFIGLKIGDREVKEHLKLHHSQMDLIAIRSELKYWIGA
jgi:hypothetical protein